MSWDTCVKCKKKTTQLYGWDEWNAVCKECFLSLMDKMKKIFMEVAPYLHKENLVLEALKKLHKKEGK